jgi:hypothetical protein
MYTSEVKNYYQVRENSYFNYYKMLKFEKGHLIWVHKFYYLLDYLISYEPQD